MPLSLPRVPRDVSPLHVMPRASAFAQNVEARRVSSRKLVYPVHRLSQRYPSVVSSRGCNLRFRTTACRFGRHPGLGWTPRSSSSFRSTAWIRRLRRSITTFHVFASSPGAGLPSRLPCRGKFRLYITAQTRPLPTHLKRGKLVWRPPFMSLDNRPGFGVLWL